MLIQVLLRDHTPLADLALVLGLKMRPLLMHVQRIAVGAGLAANVAYYRALLVLETHVQSHVALHLELFPAVLAIVFVLGPVFAIEMLLQPSPTRALEPANVARIFLRLDNGTEFAPPSDHAFRGMFSADVRVEGRFVGTLVAAEVAAIRNIFYILVVLFVYRVPMILQHLHDRETNVALVTSIDLAVFLIVGLIFVRNYYLVHRNHSLVFYLYSVKIVQRVRRHIRHIVTCNCEGVFRIVNVDFQHFIIPFPIVASLFYHF